MLFELEVGRHRWPSPISPLYSPLPNCIGEQWRSDQGASGATARGAVARGAEHYVGAKKYFHEGLFFYKIKLLNVKK